MKKLFAFILVLILSLFSGCTSTNFSKHPFVNKKWTRTTKNDTEYICFKDNGEFSYYCACGNPVNDSDLCEGYTYNKKSKTITLKYTEKTKDIVTKIIVKKCTDTELVLDFKGDIREFKIDEEFSKSDTVSFEGNTYNLIEFNADIFNYDLTVGVDYEEEKIYKIFHDKWDIIYLNGDLFALETQIEEVNLYYSDINNYSWSAKVESHDLEYLYTANFTLNNNEIEFLNNVENMDRNETIFFEDINKFAILTKTSKDGFITATTELVWRENYWYWRSEIIDEKTKGWPEFIFKLPSSLNEKINNK